METLSAEALVMLIDKYTGAVEDAHAMLRAHLGEDALLSAVNGRRIPREGQLPGGFPYSFHGVGCAVEGPDFEVDFDFGPEQRVGGFDAWRLSLFAQFFPDLSPFHDANVVARGLRELEAAGLVWCPHWPPSEHLYYRTNAGGSPHWIGRS